MTAHPVIGVTPGVSTTEDNTITLNNGTLDALWHAGAIPIMLPLTNDPVHLNHLLDTVDGVLFSGGGDVDPLRFGQYQHQQCGIITPRRDEMELPLARMAIERGNIAVFGICRGCQVLNIAMGGTVWQDIPSEYPGTPILHRQKNPSIYRSHPVTVIEGSRLHSILKTDEVLVNSLHHQAVDRPGTGFVVTAKAPDGVTEAIELTSHPFCIGVQWHPERLWETDDAADRLFQSFTDAAAKMKLL